MAKTYEPSALDVADYALWCESRPTGVRELAERFPPWELFRHRITGHRCIVSAINENGTVTIDVTGRFNLVEFDRSVFGVNPDNLEPCDMPDADEAVGTALSPEEVHNNVDALRVAIRPDLFVMGEDGRAIRKQ